MNEKNILLLGAIATIVYFCWDKVKEPFVGGNAVKVEDKGNKFEVTTGNETYNLSKVCPHAGCDVDYSPEGKFVCPCHGSEFDISGKVIHGPATENLEKVS